MTAIEARVLILDGDDEYAISQEIARHQTKLQTESESFADLNLARLDGATFNLEQLPSIAGALPFLAPRRLVILNNLTAKLPRSDEKESAKKTSPSQAKFYRLLEQIPETTLLILEVVYEASDARKDDLKKKLAALKQWAGENPGTAQVKTFMLPKGKEMARRIQQMAMDAEAEIRFDAAERLAYLVDDDPRRAAQELEKILAQNNYPGRPITIDDVVVATPDDNQGDVFALTDSLAESKIQAALDHLQRLLEYDDYFMIFSLITSHFRKLIFAREVIDRGGSDGEIQKALRLLGVNHSFPAEKITRQARRLSMEKLEHAYRLLLEVDRAKKISLTSDAMLLDFFATALSAAPGRRLMPEVEAGLAIDSIYR